MCFFTCNSTVQHQTGAAFAGCWVTSTAAFLSVGQVGGVSKQTHQSLQNLAWCKKLSIRQTLICTIHHEPTGTKQTECCNLIPGMLICRCALCFFAPCPLFGFSSLTLPVWTAVSSHLGPCAIVSGALESLSPHVPVANVWATHCLSRVYTLLSHQRLSSSLSAKVVN